MTNVAFTLTMLMYFTKGVGWGVELGGKGEMWFGKGGGRWMVRARGEKSGIYAEMRGIISPI